MLNVESGIVIGIVLICFGILNCFFGYKLFKLLLGVAAFIIGGYLSYHIALSITGVETISLIVGIIAGLIIAVVIYFFYFGGIFIIGATLGALIGMSLNIGLDETMKLAVIIILAIAGGVLALIFQKLMIIISTSFSGAYLIVNGVFYIYYWLNGRHFNIEKYYKFIQNSTTLYLIIIFISLVLGVFGILFQYKMHANDE